MEFSDLNSLTRVVQIYEQLRLHGEISTAELAAKYNKHVETIKKDIRFIGEALGPAAPYIEYDRQTKVYRMKRGENRMLHSVLLLTMLYGSRSLLKDDLHHLRDMILDLLPSSERINVRRITDSFDVNYIPMIDQALLPVIGVLLEGISQQRIVNIQYRNAKRTVHQLGIAPLSIGYDEGFYYAFAFIPGRTDRPMIRNFRLDRILEYTLTKEAFTRPLDGYQFFEAGKHVNQSFMMHSSDTPCHAVIKVELWLSEYLISKFPIHSFLRNEGDKEIYQVTVAHEESLLFWLLQQRTWAELLSPSSLRERLRETIAEMAAMYRLSQ